MWWIEQALERLRREQDGRYRDERPALQLPLPEPPRVPLPVARPHDDDDSDQDDGVVVINL